VIGQAQIFPQYNPMRVVQNPVALVKQETLYVLLCG